MIIGIIGYGVVGHAIYEFFKDTIIDVKIYDKYKNIGILKHMLECHILYLCLPTLYDDTNKEYDKSSIYEICRYLSLKEYNGILLLKSTVEPETTELLTSKYNLKIIHNPEFLSAKTAIEDFKNQNHIVLGKTEKITDLEIENIKNIYVRLFPEAKISILDSKESELMKISINTFYAIKIQYFNEIYLLANKLNISYDKIKDSMLLNGWINPMHTQVPGTDGKLSYGGMCFPKDTNALNEYIKKQHLPHKIIESTIKEQEIIRNINHKSYLE